MIEIKHRHTGKVLITVKGNPLGRADLYGTDLSDTNLRDADLHGAYLRGADMRGAYLREANLSDADLSGADLRGAYLFATDLSQTLLTDTDLSGSRLANTDFSNSDTLYLAKGLETVIHYSPSILDARTVRACVRHLPDVFLRGVGYNQEEIENLKAMYSGGSIRFYSCFISYAHLDEAFAERLHNDLEANGVVCWKDTHDMRGGDYYRNQINEAIKHHDKLVLICSKRSTVRPGVIEEIVEAMEQQEKTHSMKLFPIGLDKFIFSDEMKQIAKDRTATGDWPKNWISKISAFHIPDFSKWKDPDAYKTALEALLRDLKSPQNNPGELAE